MKEEITRRQELFKKTPEERALLKKLKAEYKKRIRNEQKKG